MSQFKRITDIRQALATKRHPTAISWNRLEGRPRTANFARAMRAEVRDPLWMLARQWQMGEFEGDDAASPVFVKAHLKTTKLRKYQPGDHDVHVFNDDIPLEARVECRPLAMEQAGQSVALDIRLMLGRYWFKLLGDKDLETAYIQAYSIELPDRAQPEGAPIFAHLEVWQSWAAVAGRRMDGYAFFQYLKADSGNRASDGIAGADAGIDALGDQFVTWAGSFFIQPAGGQDAWNPNRLEYQFQVAAPHGETEKVLVAEEYYHGHLDWYNLDHDKQQVLLGEDVLPEEEHPEQTHTHTFIPTALSFDGMPNTRWWTFEDGKTNFGEMRPNRTDIGRLLVMEFALVYANDWFLFPFTVEAGTLAEVRGMAVTNVFGERTWIEPGNKGVDDDFSRWSMFTLNTKGKRKEPADLTLAMLPVAPKVQQGKPLEEILLIRDEMANMVWGIETRIPSPSGGSMDGHEAAPETRRFFEKLAGVEPIDLPVFQANIRYEVMNEVPENWIPFIPARKGDSLQAIHLQRASMLRFFIGDTGRPKKVKPRTTLMREGLDSVPVQSYFINEEEVPRSGIKITQAFQRTRWYNGKVLNWLGVRKETGRGEGSSNLSFDRVVPVKKGE